MYFPFFRGVRAPLNAIKETADLLAKANFVPIVAPAPKHNDLLVQALAAVGDAGGNAVVVLNPRNKYGSVDSAEIIELLRGDTLRGMNVSPAILLDGRYDEKRVCEICGEFKDTTMTFVHFDYNSKEALNGIMDGGAADARHVFFDDFKGRLYRSNFENCERVLLRDGYTLRPDGDHPQLEYYSDLHATFASEGVSGFSDFLTKGNPYAKIRDPHYFVAVHLTFIDPSEYDSMFILHSAPSGRDAPRDMWERFVVALDDMIREIDEGNHPVLETEALKELRWLHGKKLFEGMRKSSALSMQHHIETLAHYFKDK